jgi:hypothetical protein
MNPLDLADAAAVTLLGAASNLDETAIDHELVHGSTIAGGAMRFFATALVVIAMPLVVIDVLAGGPQRREGRLDQGESAGTSPA